MKIVADENIPQVCQAFSDLGEIELLPGREITRKNLADCDCLLVRTVTPVDQQLLQGTAVRFVGTATIGTDHVDQGYLANQNIGFSNAAGCNAEAASEYVIAGIFALSERKGFDPFASKVGIIGNGNVGSRVKRKLDVLGIATLLNDPPRQATEEASLEYVDLDKIISGCDIITLHVPLTSHGEYPTYHLFDHDRLSKLKKNCLLINAARGPVIDNSALSTLLQQRDDLIVFLDTWENEPDISRALLKQVDLATPHIAGYSVEGRLRGTQMILDAACAHFDHRSRWNMIELLPQVKSMVFAPGGSVTEFWQNLFQAHCDIWRDHQAMLSGSELSDAKLALHFDSLRRVYDDRLEYERFKLSREIAETEAAIARRLQFQID